MGIAARGCLRSRCRGQLAPLVVTVLLTAGCGAEALNILGQEGYHWEPRGTWSGRGNVRTDPFPGETGGLRLTWMTRRTSEAGDGSFTVSVHNAESGRKIIDAIDARRADQGTAFISQSPQMFYLLIASKDTDWTVTVDETVP